MSFRGKLSICSAMMKRGPRASHISPIRQCGRNRLSPLSARFSIVQLQTWCALGAGRECVPRSSGSISPRTLNARDSVFLLAEKCRTSATSSAGCDSSLRRKNRPRSRDRKRTAVFAGPPPPGQLRGNATPGAPARSPFAFNFSAQRPVGFWERPSSPRAHSSRDYP